MKSEIEKLFGKLKEFQPHIILNSDDKTLTIHMEDCSYYADWIKGEGADIAIYRANDDNRIVGAILPLKDGIEKMEILNLNYC